MSPRPATHWPQEILIPVVKVPCEAAKLDRFWLEFSAAIPRLEERRAMKASKFSDAQKAFILKQGAEGMPVADICRKAGISQATYIHWKQKYDGLLPAEAARG